MLGLIQCYGRLAIVRDPTTIQEVFQEGIIYRWTKMDRVFVDNLFGA